jgi:hypothetical protein
MPIITGTIATALTQFQLLCTIGLLQEHGFQVTGVGVGEAAVIIGYRVTGIKIRFSGLCVFDKERGLIRPLLL